MPRADLTLQPDRCGYPEPRGTITSVHRITTGTASIELVRITPFAMLDKLAAVSGTIRSAPVAWALIRLSVDGGEKTALVVWPRPDSEYRVQVTTE